MCSYNITEVKEEKLKCNMKERQGKTSHAMQLNKQSKENYREK